MLMAGICLEICIEIFLLVVLVVPGAFRVLLALFGVSVN